MSSTAVRYPLEPLLEHLGPVETRRGHGPPMDGRACALAELLGITARSVHRWSRAGLREQWADRAACRLGVHPSLIWPDYWRNSP